MSDLSNFETVLKNNGKSITFARRIVFEVFQEHDALSMKQLLDTVDNKINRASAYRVVDLLVGLGVLRRIQIGWKYKIELSEQFSDHHHHISCRKCQKTDVLEVDDALEGHIDRIAKTVEYRLTRHTIDLVGVCRDCR